jgi:hypothetical protein
VTPELVEKYAKIAYGAVYPGAKVWDELSAESREFYLYIARQVVSAARREAREEDISALSPFMEEFSHSTGLCISAIRSLIEAERKEVS